MSNGKKSNASATTSTTQAAAPAPAKGSKKTEKKETAPAVEKSTKKEVKAVEKPVEQVEASGATEETQKKQRRKASKQSVVDDLTSILKSIQDEIARRAPKPETEEAKAESGKKSSKAKTSSLVPLKFLRTINKRLTVLQSDTSRVLKLKKQSNRDNSKSGLMKPVGISAGLFTFLKNANFPVEKTGKYPRTEITKHIHTYVKSHNLRNEKDKRIILPDDKLSKLLNYPANSEVPMTYFRLPQYLKEHFIKAE
jgi:chromatin remodeling complex protein RSC6